MGLPRNEGQSSRLESGQGSSHTRRMAIFTPNSSQPSAKQELLLYYWRSHAGCTYLRMRPVLRSGFPGVRKWLFL